METQLPVGYRLLASVATTSNLNISLNEGEHDLLVPSPPTDTFPLLQELLNDVPANVTDATDGEVRIQYPDMSCCVCNTWGYLSSSSTSFRVMTHENIIHFFPSFNPAGATLGDGNSANARCGSTGHQTQRAAARAHGPAHAVQVQLHRPRGSASGNSESSHTVSRPVVEPRQAGCKTSTSTASATRQHISAPPPWQITVSVRTREGARCGLGHTITLTRSPGDNTVQTDSERPTLDLPSDPSDPSSGFLES
ncbi:hypothetical protein BGY98DRAFT_983286 [Russula aff. rugulosa BPL654]|nr:hypothetical protein BGY98DRAFT_983286 [Russula aff. rugulosa BPL654]